MSLVRLPQRMASRLLLLLLLLQTFVVAADGDSKGVGTGRSTNYLYSL
jgi:hypothetical protein